MSANCQGIIFDMDGLLFDTERVGRWAWQQAMADHGYVLSDEIYTRFIGRDIRHRHAILRSQFGEDFPFDAVTAQRIALGDAREVREGLPPKPGVRRLLVSLAEANVPVALATGTARARAVRRLEAVGIRGYFGTVVTSEDVAHGKPAPDIFIEASRRMGLSPTRCVVFEDSSAGIAAASAAGMPAILVPDMEEPTAEAQALAYRVISSLEDAAAVLQELLERRLPRAPAAADGVDDR